MAEPVIHHADRCLTTRAGVRRRSWQRARAVLAHLAAVRPGLLNGGERRFARGWAVPGDDHPDPSRRVGAVNHDTCPGPNDQP
jgi:hypothetical protein